MKENMLHTEKHTTDPGSLVSAEAAFRHYYVGQTVPAPNVHDELRLFHRRRNSRSHLRPVLLAVAATAAAVLSGVFLLRSLLPADREKPVTVFLADEALADVRLENQYGDLALLGTAGNADELLRRFGASDTGRELDFRPLGKQGSGVMQTLTTPRRKDYKVILPDGSEVWLNADSRLSFPDRFTGRERAVQLQGEAYFKVAKDRQHPFVVYAGGLRTMAIGTEFNVRSYSPDDTHVTLVEGSVETRNRLNGEGRLLEPGEKLHLATGGKIEVTVVETENYAERKEGYFSFDNAPLVEIMRDLGRWYNVDIVFARPSLGNIRLHFVTKRTEDLDEALYLLNSLNVVEATRKGNSVYIK